MGKEKRNLFNKIFKGNTKMNNFFNYLRMLNGYNVSFSELESDYVYDNNLARTCINTIAIHCAKLEPQHVQVKNGTRNHIYGDINFLLSNKPNYLMSTFDFLYKIISILFANNNCFIYVDRDEKGMIKGFFPINAPLSQLLQTEDGRIILEFQFVNGNVYYADYATQIIHLRKFYNRHDIYGEDNNSLKIPIETVQTTNEGFTNAIKTSLSLKGILKYSGLLKEKDISKNRDDFVADFTSMEKSSGVAALDEKADFKPIEMKPVTLNEKQLEFVNDNLFNHFGVNKKIIQNSYSDEEWNAFFEGVIEPLAIQMSYAFTNSIFNNKAINDGNQIVFDVNRIRYAKTETKISLIKEVATLGIMTVDEARGILDMRQLGGAEGNKRLQTLNVVNADKADTYQLGGKSNGKSDKGN